MTEKQTKRPTREAATKQARVLLACEIAGKRYKANALIEAPAAVINAEERAGRVDSHPAAVAMAEK